MTTTDHDILRIEGNVSLPNGYKQPDFENYFHKFMALWEFNFAGTITDEATSPHVLILKEDLEGLHNRIERQRDAIEYLKEKEVQQGIEFKEITESLQRKQKLLDKAWADYDQVVKELTKERAKITKLEEENARLLKAFKEKASKPNVFKRIWKAFVKWFRSTVNQ